MFKLGKLEFEVKQATINGCYYEAVVNKRSGNGKAEEAFLWFIEIDMAERDFIYELNEEDLEDLEEGEEFVYESVSPRLYHNNGFQLNISSWKELEGLTLNWESKYNASGEEAGTLYVFEHENVTKGKIEILERREDRFLICWSGTANVFWDDEYGQDVPFIFEGEVTFTGINAYSDVMLSEEDLKTAMKKFIKMDEVVCKSQSNHKIMKGNSYVWNFVPV